MNLLKWAKIPYIFFLPFLFIYITIALLFPTLGFEGHGDQGNYLRLATNLINGYYSSPHPNINLGNGPGYPILLVPFLALKLPFISMTILNAILYYLSVVILFKGLLKVSTSKIALFFSLFWGFYFNLYIFIPDILTEILTAFLVTLLIIFVLKAFEIPSLKSSIKFMIISGFIIGYLALTKPIFGYVIMLSLSGTFVLLITNLKSVNYQKSFCIFLIALTTTLPYLAYTYSLTGRMFYWSSLGGNNLYWMSSTAESEVGSWIAYPPTKEDAGNRIPGSNEKIIKHHKNNMDTILQYEAVKQDDMYRKIAINNIISNPLKFMQNIGSNIGRMMFNFPYSYKMQNPGTLLRLPQNGFIIVLLIFCLIPTIINWKQILYPIRFLVTFAFIYLGGSTLGSAEIRMFAIILPIFLAWIAYVIPKTFNINLKWDSRIQN